jgi:hypothetical protein
MEIKDINGETRIKFSAFKKQYEGEPIFIDLSVEIYLDNSLAKESITIELSDLASFLKNLEILNGELKQTFYFQHSDQRIEIKFEPLTTGNIKVSGFLRDILYANSLNFSFEMPPSNLPNLIRNCENLVDVLR